MRMTLIFTLGLL